MRVRRSATGQVAMEYLIVFSMAFFMTIPLIIIFGVQTDNLQQDINIAQVNKLTSEVVDAAEEVYYMGAPSQKVLEVTFPNGVENITVGPNSITFGMILQGSDYMFYEDTLVNLSGSLRTSPGRREVKVLATDFGVYVTDE